MSSLLTFLILLSPYPGDPSLELVTCAPVQIEASSAPLAPRVYKLLNGAWQPQDETWLADRVALHRYCAMQLDVDDAPYWTLAEDFEPVPRGHDQR